MRDVVNFPAHIIRQQIVDVVAECHPRAVKVGLVRTPEAVGVISEGIVGIRRIVVAPGIMASNNVQLVDDETIDAIRRRLVPMASLLVLRQVEAEKILGVNIATDSDMVAAAQSFIDMGAEYVMIRGGRITEGRVTALLLGNDVKQFFSSYNIEGWKQHGVGGALSTAVATRLGMGDDVPDAVRNAHEFVHSRIVYSVEGSGKRMRPADIYNAFMNQLSNNYQRAHDVAFYADKLNITTRYLSQITNESVSKSPKQIIADYLVCEARQVLENSRLSVKEVSDNLGFRAVSVFCKLFKQQTGFTPSEYRLHIVG
jgi:hydroxymethylpyrimidine/phosphomethylpyrimidine kinase